jgi:uncharacterized protein (TIGR02996 family)
MEMDSVSLASDEEAMIAAITAAPTDDAPRLVYADWLQERGDEAKSDYLRTVVRLMHPPEDHRDVDHCVALAEGLDEVWRHRVGGRFEVVLEGAAPLLLVVHVVRAIWNIAVQEAVDFWSAGRPVRLKSAMTREDAEQLINSFGTDLLHEGENLPPLKLTVRLMTDEGGLGLLAPRS